MAENGSCSAAFCESVALQEITDSLPLIRRYAPPSPGG